MTFGSIIPFLKASIQKKQKKNKNSGIQTSSDDWKRWNIIQQNISTEYHTTYRFMSLIWWKWFASFGKFTDLFSSVWKTMIWTFHFQQLQVVYDNYVDLFCEEV